MGLSLPQSLVASSDALVLNLGGQHSASSSSAEGLSVGQSGSEELDVMGVEADITSEPASFS